MQKKYHTQTKMSKDGSRNANEEDAHEPALMTMQAAEQDKSK